MLLSLTNSKADVGVRLDSAQRKISTYSDVQAEFAARDEDNNVSSGGWRWCLKLLPAGKRHPGEWPQARCEAPDDRGAFIPQTGVAREISLVCWTRFSFLIFHNYLIFLEGEINITLCLVSFHGKN